MQYAPLPNSVTDSARSNDRGIQLLTQNPKELFILGPCRLNRLRSFHKALSDSTSNWFSIRSIKTVTAVSWFEDEDSQLIRFLISHIIC